MTVAIDLRPDHLAIVEHILAEHVPECEVRAFGSRATWTARDYSDLDLAVVGDGPLHRRTLSRLREAFEESRLPMLVDVVDWHDIPQSFQEMIQRDYEVLQERKGAGKHTTLGDVADIVMGQSPPGDTVSPDQGLPLLNGPTEFGPHHPTPAQFTTDARKKAKPGDVLFCVRGSTTGRMNWADREYAIGRGVAAIRHREGQDLQPMLRGVIEHHLPALLAQATGSTFPNVSATQVAEIPYPEIGLDEQRAIAHVLGTLDDKIELNRRMNETIEAMARALFRSWFVDFEPVRAKMEGRWRPGQSLPGLPAHLHPFFPDRLVPSELGDIPEGWEVRSVGEMAALSSGKRPAERHSQQSALASIPVWGGNGPMAYVPDPLVTEPILLTGRVGTLGSVFRITSPCWPSDNTLILRAHDRVWFEYIYFHLKGLDFASLNRGSTQPLLAQRDLASQALPCPSKEVVSVFHDTARRSFAQVDVLASLSSVLATLRDTLLPKLVTGDVPLKPSGGLPASKDNS